jgi:multisubunit Na+/H+ antiporter MnhE subunit
MRLGLTWGALVWLLFVRSANVAVLIGLVVGSALFGVLTVVLMQRRRPRDLDATTP